MHNAFSYSLGFETPRRTNAFCVPPVDFFSSFCTFSFFLSYLFALDLLPSVLKLFFFSPWDFFFLPEGVLRASRVSVPEVRKKERGWYCGLVGR